MQMKHQKTSFEQVRILHTETNKSKREMAEILKVSTKDKIQTFLAS